MTSTPFCVHSDPVCAACIEDIVEENRLLHETGCDDIVELRAEVAELRAENKRLRAALDRIFSLTEPAPADALVQIATTVMDALAAPSEGDLT